MPPNDENIEKNSQLRDEETANTALLADKYDNLDNVITTQPEKKVEVPSENFEISSSKNSGQSDCATCVMLFCDAFQACGLACFEALVCCDATCCAECSNATVEGLGECLQACGECCLVCTQCFSN